MDIGVVWAQFGPYHFARAAALKKLAGRTRVHALELADRTAGYQWKRSEGALELITLCPGSEAEKLAFRQVFLRARKAFAELKLGVCILPSYAPKQSLAALLAARSLGIRTVMMNETHQGTARACGLAKLVKRQLVSMFDAALVGGAPQRRYFASLGLPVERIFAAYDAVDNDYFAQRAEEIRGQSSKFRDRYSLPEHYFLSLGRFVAKKNLSTLIKAYRLFLDSSQLKETHLVLVGSGEEGTRLRWLCHHLKLPLYDKTKVGPRHTSDDGKGPFAQPAAVTGTGSVAAQSKVPGVHFYGFRQIEENPVFYAFADAFILPSLWEEWGLVVNEAMASGLPVVVSETAGCAEDLLEGGLPPNCASTTSLSQARDLQIEHRIRENGLVFDPKATGELSRILLFLESSPRLRAIMGGESRRIVSKFSCEKFGENALHAAQAALERR